MQNHPADQSSTIHFQRVVRREWRASDAPEETISVQSRRGADGRVYVGLMNHFVQARHPEYPAAGAIGFVLPAGADGVAFGNAFVDAYDVKPENVLAMLLGVTGYADAVIAEYGAEYSDEVVAEVVAAHTDPETIAAHRATAAAVNARGGDA